MSQFLTSLAMATDEQVMWRVKLEGDPQAFARLMQRWEQPIRRLCLRMTGDAHRAQDLAQTAFLRVFSQRDQWEPTGRFSTFLWRVAINLCHDDLRKRQRRGECSLDALDEAGDGLEMLAGAEPAPDAEAQTRERGELVRQALLRLAPHYREVLVLRHYEGLKFQEIARVLDIPEGTVKSRMAEGLNQLGRWLGHLRDDATTGPGSARSQ